MNKLLKFVEIVLWTLVIPMILVFCGIGGESLMVVAATLVLIEILVGYIFLLSYLATKYNPFRKPASLQDWIIAGLVLYFFTHLK